MAGQPPPHRSASGGGSVPPPGAASPAHAPGEAPPPASGPRALGRPWTAVAAIGVGFVAGQTLVLIVVAIGQAVGGSTLRHPSPAVSVISDVMADLAFVGAALYFSARGRRPRPADFGFRLPAPGRAALGAAIAWPAYFAVSYLYAQLVHLHGSDKLPSELGVHHSTAALVAAAVFVCVIAPAAEEFFFRGFLFGVLSQWRVTLFGREVGIWLAALVVAILFGLAHTGSAAAQYLIPLGFLGFVLCLLRWKTGSLYPGMAVHSFNNSLALGINELHWSSGAIVGLILAGWATLALLTGPLADGRPVAPLGADSGPA